MNYWSRKYEMQSIARKHIKYVSEKFKNEIVECIKTTEIYDEKDCENLIKSNSEKTETTKHILKLEKEDIITSIFGKTNKKSTNVAVLNFASFKFPGGKFIEGSLAQEESICHSSILYPVLKSFEDTYYSENRSNVNKALYRHKLLYTPNVLFMNEKGKTRKIDVITMAAPNRGGALRNEVSDTEIYTVMRERIKCILEVASKHGINTLFLGAYGCGVFKNEAKIVAQIILDEVKLYGMKFIFPIPDDENYNAFWNILVENFKIL